MYQKFLVNNILLIRLEYEREKYWLKNFWCMKYSNLCFILALEEAKAENSKIIFFSILEKNYFLTNYLFLKIFSYIFFQKTVS